MDFTGKRVVLLALLAATSQVDGNCELLNLKRKTCEGELSCIDDFGNAIAYVRDWSCRRREVYDYDYGYRRIRVDDDYKLYVTAENIDGTSFDSLGAVNELRDHILTLSITKGKMNSVPAAIYNLHKVSTVDLSGNTLESLKLESFLTMKNLTSLNVSRNHITDLEVSERSVGGGFSPVHIIDLSYNAIGSIPNNYFRQFSELLYLDLSHNYIKSFDILTFEGITQLQTLHISDNKITNIGVSFARFVYLKELFLDLNYLTSIEESNFNKMKQLEKLNVSANFIKDIDNAAFDNLVALKEINLSNNTINAITKTMFQNSTNLQSLDISLNSISKIEPGAFEGKRIQEFNIHNNPISGSLLKNSFQGIFVKNLDLSGAKITELGPDLFDGQYETLNCSRNSIKKVHKTTFSKLEYLTVLDLSYNQLQDIEFDMNLKNLSNFYINNNNIKKITKNMFKAVTSLKIVDLSNNEIEDVEIFSFENLHDLESLNLYNNPLVTVIPPNMFSGLSLTTDLDFTDTKINTIQNNAFNGMGSIKTFNSSHSSLSVLEANAFNGTGSIEVLDLSYNQIESFSINNTNIKVVKDLYLDHNRLRHVNANTFSGLTDLRKLTLHNNNLIRIDDVAFRGLRNLLRVDLSVNKEMGFNSSIFSNLQSLSLVLLDNVTSTFNFANIVNSSISALDVSFCDISDINSVQVYQIITLERLKLASNKIRAIDKTSFQKLSQLSWLDLSYNRISSIQPGSFNDTEDLSVLNLSNNFLSSLKFGVLDGLMNLNILDLSSNTLHSFSADIFHNIHRVNIVYVDDNLIDDINLYDFNNAKIKELYIGGNPIPCSKLTEFKKYDAGISAKLLIKAKIVLYDTENVDGITCKSKTRFDDLSITHGNETALTALLTGALEEFRITVERFLERNESKTDLGTVGFQNVSYSIEKFLEVFNKSETKNNDFLEKLTNINNSTNRALENIQEYIKVRNVIAVDSTPETSDAKVNADEIERTMIAMLAKEKQTLKNEFRSMFDDWKLHNGENNNFEAQSASVGGSTDLKSALYFIATCLAALLCLLVLSLLFVFFRLRNGSAYSNHLSLSRQPISNVMEME